MYYTEPIKDNGSSFSCELELAGFSKDNVKITANKHHLRIKAKKEGVSDRDFICRLGNKIDIESITSKMENGLLTLTLPKSEYKESIQVPIN